MSNELEPRFKPSFNEGEQPQAVQKMHVIFGDLGARLRKLDMCDRILVFEGDNSLHVLIGVPQTCFDSMRGPSVGRLGFGGPPPQLNDAFRVVEQELYDMGIVSGMMIPTPDRFDRMKDDFEQRGVRYTLYVPPDDQVAPQAYSTQG